MKYIEMDGSMQEEYVAEFVNSSRTDNCTRMNLRSRDIEAALVLMQLSNDVSGLLQAKMQSTISKGDCYIQRNQKRRKGNGSTRTPLECMNNHVVKEDNLYKRRGSFGNKGLSLLKLKKARDRMYKGRQVELNYHCVKAKKVQEEYEDIELPISSLRRRELPNSSYKKCGIKKVEVESRSCERSTTFSSFSAAKAANSRIPTAHKGISFSIIHFLFAIRTAMISPEAKDGSSTFSQYPAKRDPESVNRYDERKGISNSQGEQSHLPCLTVHEIVERIRWNPGDPCILEAREPLQDLVRGALRIFSSTTAPLGAKAWKALTRYSKSDKSWSWIGPVSLKPQNHMIESVSSEAWGLSSSTLLKLVNSYADWLKIAQESLHKIGDLPAPPLNLMHQTVNVKERFRKGMPRKIVATISQCPEAIRDYFRKEEAVRYFVPERAFSYTALDGRKSTVAPLRRCSGKPSIKCRDHFMLKADRPPNITLLSLVRDAAARLPEAMGTRADICILIRDSQYIVEDISEEQLNQVVSGALDRLHYEHDPCVQFNGERRLWFYLHGDREEDDFEPDATSSIKKRRRLQEI